MIAPQLQNAARKAFLLPLVAVAVIFGGSFVLFSGCGLQTSGIPSTSDAGACVSASECDDGNPCTNDTCNATSGECENTPVADGPAPGAEQKQGTCKQVVCKGGESETVADPSNAPKSTDVCTVAKCNGETPEMVPAADKTPCNTSGVPGLCESGVCKVVCSTSADCPDMGACQTVTCNGATGSCEYTSVMDGTPTPGVTQVPGDCKQHICLMGQDVDAPDNSDVPTLPAAMAGCADAKCNSGTPEFPLHAPDSPCSTFMGSQPGFCSATGECVECTQDTECVGTSPSNDCQHPSCQSNACAPAFTAPNTATKSNPPQVSGDCQQIVCNGSGGTTTIPDATDVPSDPTGCNPGTCSGSPLVPGHGTSANGTSCGMNVSCLNGVCTGCAGDAQCQTNGRTNGKCIAGACSCVPSTCAGLGLSCGTANDGCGGMGNLPCNDAKLDGNETAIDCGGNTSSCATRCAQGQTCKVTSDCQSGLTCADGVCCNMACSGSCEACTAALKGQGMDGACGAVAMGHSDPRGQCQSQAASTCGEDGATCNGSGACTTWPTGTVCSNAACGGSTLTEADTCAGGKCTAPTPATVSCSPYKCASATACATSCTLDTDCFNNTYYCSGGTCTAKLGAGTACTATNQCTSGFCVSGVCCNMACGGQCQACSKALTGGSDGTCADVTAGTTDPSGACGAQAASTCGTDGKCAANGACENWASGTVCGQCKTCNGNGTCNAVAAGTVDPAGMCMATTPASSCGTDGKCAAGGACEMYGNSTVCGTPSCDSNTEMLTSQGTCNGSGSCTLPMPTSCGHYVCNGTSACFTSCGTTAYSDGACATNFYCDGVSSGTCQAKLNDGGSCSNNDQCVNGNCVSGICCHTACTDQGAASCGTNGTCKADGSTCLLYPAGTTGCTGPGSMTTCSGSTQTITKSACDGAGNCSQTTTPACPSGFKCSSGFACYSSCTMGTGRCASGLYCNSNQTSCTSTNSGAACSTGGDCSSGTCTSMVCQ